MLVVYLLWLDITLAQFGYFTCYIVKCTKARLDNLKELITAVCRL